MAGAYKNAANRKWNYGKIGNNLAEFYGKAQNKNEVAEVAVILDVLIGAEMEEICRRLDKISDTQIRHGKLLKAICEELGIDWKIVLKNQSKEDEADSQEEQ